MGASQIIAIDVDQAALDRSRALGADLAINSSSADPVAEIPRHLGQPGTE